MPHTACIEFLQWALPRLGFSWPGFRRVHRQVCRRVGARVQALHLSGPQAYQAYLASHPDEWATLDSLCRITTSRFMRDPPVFEALGANVLPALATAAAEQGAGALRAWSVGCASGEEPYSLALLWQIEVQPRYPSLELRVVASDADPHLVERARRARFRRSSVKDVPAAWLQRAFDRSGEWFTLRDAYRLPVTFQVQDVRAALPEGAFDLILCRNLVFTYFDDAGRRRALERLLGALRAGGVLVIGAREELPGGVPQLRPWEGARGVYIKQQ